MKHDSGCHCEKFRCQRKLFAHAVHTTVKLWSEKSKSETFGLEINLHKKGIKKMRKTIIIFAASKARKLLKEGFQIVDIKPNRRDETHMQSVFVFKFDEKILKFL